MWPESRFVPAVSMKLAQSDQTMLRRARNGDSKGINQAQCSGTLELPRFIIGSVKREFSQVPQLAARVPAWAVLNPLAMIFVYIPWSSPGSAYVPNLGVDNSFGYSIYLCRGRLPGACSAGNRWTEGQNVFIDSAKSC